MERSIRTVTNSVHNFHVGPFLSVSEDLKETGTQLTLRIRRQISQDFFFSASYVVGVLSVSTMLGMFSALASVLSTLCIFLKNTRSYLFFTNAKSYLIGLIDRLINLLVFY